MPRSIHFGLLVMALLALGVPGAVAIDAPHTNVCGQCHITHGALGANLSAGDTVGNLCMSCHLVGGSANNKAFAAADQSVHWLGLGTNLTSSGTSHRWDSSFAGRSVFIGGAGTASVGKVRVTGVYTGAYPKIFTLSITNGGQVGTARFSWVANMDGGGGTNILTATNAIAINQGLSVYFQNGPTNQMAFQVRDRWQIIVRNDTRWPTNESIVFVLTNGGGGMVTCASCHDEKFQTHQPFDTNAPAYGGAHTGAGRHFLRADNDHNQLCTDCHAVRAVTNSSLGSHPVGITVTTGLYFKLATNLPYETGTTNILCMTCHSVHNAATSDGTLLRRTNGVAFCGGCHTIADTATPAAHFNPTNYMTLWPGGQYGSLFPAHSNAADRGSCLDCHFVHGWPSATNPATHNPKLLVDFEENICFTCHDANGPAVENVKSDFDKAVHHPVKDSEQMAGRSVECSDCHNTHRALVGVHNYTNIATATRNRVSPSMTNVAGVAVDFAGLTNFASIPLSRYTTIPGRTGATNEYEICFKCHTAYGFANYSAGTASFSSNSATVTGSGTAWTTNLIGMSLARTNDPVIYTVTAVASATSLTIQPAYIGTTAAGQGYVTWDVPPGLTPFYTNGTATFTTNSATVTGSGTVWSNRMIGSWIYPLAVTGKAYQVVAVASATSLTIQPAYDGATASGQRYGVFSGTDVAQEFSPRNRSGHPIVTGLDNYTNSLFVTNGTARRGLSVAMMKAPWNVNIGQQTMMCSDCHNTDNASTAAQGPHGSAAQYTLRGPNAANWPNVLLSAFNTSWCANCHNNFGGLHTRSNHTTQPCYACHVVVPHGGKMSRLIGDRDGSMPARYAWNNVVSNCVVYSYTKSSTNTYSEGNCRVSCGSHATGSSATMENW